MLCCLMEDNMNKLIAALLVVTSLVFIGAPVASMVITSGHDQTDIDYQCMVQAPLVYRCLRYKKAWPCQGSDMITLPGAMVIMSMSSNHYDPRGVIEDKAYAAETLRIRALHNN